MWTIKVRGESHEWQNEKNDDFLRYLPKALKCGPEEIEAFWSDAPDAEPVKLVGWPYEVAGDGTIRFLGHEFG